MPGCSALWRGSAERQQGGKLCIKKLAHMAAHREISQEISTASLPHPRLL
jgi:hypothetical protein